MEKVLEIYIPSLAGPSSRFLVVLLFSVFIFFVGCSSVSKEPSFRIKPATGRDFGSQSGLLVLKLNFARSGVWYGATNIEEKVYSYTLKNIRTGFSKKIIHKSTHGVVLELPAGRYCIDSVDVGANKIQDCSSAFFDVEESAVEIGGVVFLDVDSGNTVALKDVTRPNKLSEYSLTNQDENSITYFSDKKLDGRNIWYLETVMGRKYALILRDGGVAELKQYTLTFPGYDNGKWRLDGEQAIVSFNNDRLKYIFSLNASVTFGLAQSSYVTSEPWASVDEEWLFWVGRSPFFEATPFNDERDYYVVVAPGIGYPEDAYKKGLTGVLELEFELKPDVEKPLRYLYKPESIRVISTTNKQIKFESILKDFSKYRYYVKENRSTLRDGYREKLHLKYVDGLLKVSTSEDPKAWYNSRALN